MAGILSCGAKLGYKNTSTYKDIPNLQSIPQLGGDPEKIDVTVLTDTAKRYINGLQDFDALEFVFLFDPDVSDGAWSTLSEMSRSDDKDWRVSIPKKNGSTTEYVTFSFTGQPSVKMNEVNVNEALTFTLSIQLSGEMTIGSEGGA